MCENSDKAIKYKLDQNVFLWNNCKRGLNANLKGSWEKFT